MTSSVSSSSGYTSTTSSTASISGLVSGIDSASIVSQLMSIESAQQTQLKTQLTSVQADSAAYRDINTSFAALQTAAAALTGTSISSNRTASSTTASATATADSTASVGNSVTFTVDHLASAQTVMSQTEYTSATAPLAGSAEPQFPLTVLSKSGATLGTITLPTNGSLNDAAAAINNSGLGLNATVVQLGTNAFHLQVTSSKTGADNAFTLKSNSETSATAGSAFTITTKADNAVLLLDGSGLQASSSTNTFASLLTGVSVTVNAATPPGGASTTISVANDTSAISGKVQALVDAANAALTKITTYTDSSSGSTAPLKGDWPLLSLSNQILDAVTSAVGGTDSAASAGLAVDRYGAITFNASTFAAKLSSDPAFVARVFGGVTGAGADNIRNTPDDTLDTDGIGARLLQLAARASDSTTGILTSLAKGEDTRATDLTSQIDAWTLRLTARQQTLTDQFNAMETALGTLKSQASWLTSQINALPSNAKSS